MWLPRWEWDCCGEILVPGSRRVFNVDYVSAQKSGSFEHLYGLNVDAIESHHEDGGSTRIAGIVEAVYGVEETRLQSVPRIPWPPRFGEDLPDPIEAVRNYSAYLIELQVDVE